MWSSFLRWFGRGGGSIHERLDLEKWIKLFPLEGMASFVHGPTLTGPGEVAMAEQVKREAIKSGRKLGQALPVDLIVWNWGEAPSNSITKVGGVPYRSADRPWPTAGSGEPLTFIAQFCFVDSKDIRSNLPGDILLIFGTEPGRSEECMQFEWVNLSNEKLIAPAEIPKTAWAIQPCFGSLHRTSEFPDADPDAFEAKSPIDSWARGGAGTKIGGIAGDVYDYSIHLDESESNNPSEEHEWALSMIEREKTKGDLLCRLDSICPGPKWPFLNLPESNWRSFNDANLLVIEDAGAIEIFINEDGDITFDTSSG